MNVFERVAGARLSVWVWAGMWMCAALAVAPPANAVGGASEADVVFSVDHDLLRWVEEERLAALEPLASGPVDLDLLAPCAFEPRRKGLRVLSRPWFETRSSSMARDLVLLAFETVDRLKPSFGRGPDIDVTGGFGQRRPRARMPLVTIELPFDLDVVDW